MKILYIILGVMVLIIIGWLIPIDGPFDITPQEVIQQYERSRGSIAPIKKDKIEFSEEELEFLEEQYNTQLVPICN